MKNDKPVFYDPEQKRWRFIKIGFTVFSTLLILLFCLFIVNLYNTPELNNPAFNLDDHLSITSDPKKIALTFDDGPNPNYTPQILDVLKKTNTHATFFVVGFNA